jgi:hypothetical protein
MEGINAVGLSELAQLLRNLKGVKAMRLEDRLVFLILTQSRASCDDNSQPAFIDRASTGLGPVLVDSYLPKDPKCTTTKLDLTKSSSRSERSELS